MSPKSDARPKVTPTPAYWVVTIALLLRSSKPIVVFELAWAETTSPAASSVAHTSAAIMTTIMRRRCLWGLSAASCVASRPWLSPFMWFTTGLG